MAPDAIPGCGLCGRSESHPAILTAPALHRAPIAWAVLLPSSGRAGVEPARHACLRMRLGRDPLALPNLPDAGRSVH